MKTRNVVLVAVALIAACVAVYLNFSSGQTSSVDPAVVDAAAASSREHREHAPLQDDEPVHKNRARPGVIGAP